MGEEEGGEGKFDRDRCERDDGFGASDAEREPGNCLSQTIGSGWGTKGHLWVRFLSTVFPHETVMLKKLPFCITAVAIETPS